LGGIALINLSERDIACPSSFEIMSAFAGAGDGMMFGGGNEKFCV
jgi:hypothetical protein